jgi:hypothetical protein
VGCRGCAGRCCNELPNGGASSAWITSMSITTLVAMLDTRAANALMNDSTSRAGTTIRVQVEIHIQMSGKLV